MFKQRLPILLPVIVLATLVAACTATVLEESPDRSRKVSDPWQDRLLANAAKAYTVAAKPREVTRDSLLKDDKRKLYVTNFKAKVGNRDGRKDSVVETTVTCTAAVGTGKGHEIAFAEALQPMMSEEDNVSTVTDKTTGNTRTYRMDQELQRFTVSDAGQQLRIITNPDGSYTIDGKPAATPADAAKLIVATDLGKNTSVESLAAIYGTLLERRKATLALCGGGATGPQEDPADLVGAVIDALTKAP